MVDVVDRSAYAAAPLKRISWGRHRRRHDPRAGVSGDAGPSGAGIGLATIDPQSGDTPALTTFGSASGIWAVLTVLIATFLGAFAAARFAVAPPSAMRRLHGVTTWATATLVAVYLLTSGASALVTSAFGALGSTVSSLGSAVSSVIPNSIDSLPPELQQQARQLLQRGENQAQQAAGQAQDQAQQAADQARQATGQQDLDGRCRRDLQGSRSGRDAAAAQRRRAGDFAGGAASARPRPSSA